jgi:hydroxypyruvate isomerase
MNQGPRWDIETLAHNAATLGCQALELVDPKHWDVLSRHGLICAATKSHTFVRGMNNPGHWPECHAKLRTAIGATSAAGFPNVMTFTGLMDTSKEPNGSVVGSRQGIDNCVRAYKEIVGLAERSKVTLILEPLNTRDAAPMKGHPGYLGDHVDECAEIIRRVGSPSLKLLFDVYHIQIMDGDLIRRIRELRESIAHVQVAGCPGRGPLGLDQEIQYAAVMRAFADIGYDGYIGHEWIATGDADAQLAEAVGICTV